MQEMGGSSRGALHRAMSQRGGRQGASSTFPSHLDPAQSHCWLQSSWCSSASEKQQLSAASKEKTMRRLFGRCERGSYYCFLTCFLALAVYTPRFETPSNTHLNKYNLLPYNILFFPLNYLTIDCLMIQPYSSCLANYCYCLSEFHRCMYFGGEKVGIIYLSSIIKQMWLFNLQTVFINYIK